MIQSFCNDILHLNQTMLAVTPRQFNVIAGSIMAALFGFVLIRAIFTGRIWGWTEETCPETGEIYLKRLGTITFKSSPIYFLALFSLFGLFFVFCLACIFPALRWDATWLKDTLPKLTPTQGANTAVGSILFLLSCVMANTIFSGEVYGFARPREKGSYVYQNKVITFQTAPIEFTFWVTLFGFGIAVCVAYFLGLLPLPAP